MTPAQLSQLKELGDQIATEVVFAEPGKDTGLLPVNFLLRKIEQLIAAPTDAPQMLTAAVQGARSWIDQILAGPGTFAADDLQRFSAWTDWIQRAAANIAEGESPPEASWNPQAAATNTPQPTPAPTAAGAASAAADEPVVTINADADAELLREFLNESAEHLQNIEQGVLVLEDNPADADTLNSIFRAFHTFKGGSGILDLVAIQMLAHDLESLLDEARNGRLTITSPIIDVILEGGDTLKQFTTEIEARFSTQTAAGPIIVPTRDLRARIRAILEARDAPASSAAAPASIASAAPAEAVIAAVPPSPSPAVISDAPVAPPGPPPSPAASAAAKPASRGPGGTSEKTGTAAAVKVDTNKLDSLVDLVGELVIAQSLVVQSSTLADLGDPQLTRNLAQLGRITRDLQRTAMSLRMVPIRSTFQKMNRLVRDAAPRIGKQVDLVIAGEETELDRTIVEELSDPLVHMIRNAIDHGIETPDVRTQRGKPAQGTIWLRAFHQGGNIVVEIKDDGNGLDPQRLLRKAVEKGIVGANANLSENEIFNLIFAAGFSTAEKVTDLSGRGVGMDVVRRNIEKLRGKVEIQSVLGQGSTFSIYLPLTLAIIDGLILGIGAHRYILPTLSVCESFRPTPGMITTIHGRGEMLSVRGRLCPVLRLHRHLDVAPATDDPTQSIAVVVEAGKNSRCLLVDRLLGKQEVVIKSLGPAFQRSPLLAGAAILGDGRVGLILDPDALVHLKTETPVRAA